MRTATQLAVPRTSLLGKFPRLLYLPPTHLEWSSSFLGLPLPPLCGIQFQISPGNLRANRTAMSCTQHFHPGPPPQSSCPQNFVLTDPLSCAKAPMTHNSRRGRISCTRGFPRKEGECASPSSAVRPDLSFPSSYPPSQNQRLLPESLSVLNL